MDLKKLAPWNWFKKEHDDQQAERSLTVRRSDSAEAPASGGISPVVQLHREIDRLFDEAFRSFGVGFPVSYWPSVRTGWGSVLRPALDIQETDRQYRISLEIPGVDEKDIQVTLTDDVLVVRGEKRQEQEHGDGQLHWVERSYGSFQRSLNLPDDADQDSIKASFKSGVLTLTIDKRQTASAPRGRSIPITS
jgi:HSP20 family protein